MSLHLLESTNLMLYNRVENDRGRRSITTIAMDNWVEADRRVFAQKKDRINRALQGETGLINGVLDENKEEIFYMLLFCLAVPQGRADKAEEAIEVLRQSNYFQSDLTTAAVFSACSGRTRFQTTKSKRLIEAKDNFEEIWAILKNQYKGYIAVQNGSEECKLTALNCIRNVLIKSIKGVGMKLASVSHDTNILIRRDCKSLVATIDTIKCGDEVLSLNRHMQIEFSPVKNVWDHGNRHTLKILCEGYREIEITEDHSVYSLDDEANICEIQGAGIKKGDFLLFVSDFCSNNENCIYFELSNILNLKGSIHIKEENLQEVVYLFKLTNSPYVRKHRRNLPIEMLSQVSPEHIDSLRYRTSRYHKTSLAIDDDMCWIMGVYAAEGTTNRKGRLEFCIGSDEINLKNKIKERFKKCFDYNLTVRKENERNVLRLICDNYFIVQFFRFMFKDKLLSCEISGVKYILDMSPSCISNFILGYWEGDGWHSNDQIFNISSCSRNMIFFLRLCASSVGIDARITLPCKLSNQYNLTANTPMSKLGFNRVTRSHRDSLPVARSLLLIHKLSGLPSKVKHRHTDLYKKIMEAKQGCSKQQVYRILDEIKQASPEIVQNVLYRKVLGLAVSSEVNFVRVTKVCESGVKRVFDIETENHNFVCSDSLLLAHNSHFMRNIGMPGLAILDVHVLKCLHKRGLIDSDKPYLDANIYRQIEYIQREYAQTVGISIEQIDFLMWSEQTGYVFK